MSIIDEKLPGNTTIYMLKPWTDPKSNKSVTRMWCT